MNFRQLILPALLIGSISFVSCNKDDENPSDNTFNIFSVDDDIELGEQLRDEIAASPDQYPVLSEEQYPEAYGHIRRLRDEILATDKLIYGDRFAWEVRIIEDDNTLNAFAAPGGFIYVYTGLIKYLDSEHELAGVMGHEMAHADRRHSTDQMTKQYGISVLLSVAFGDNESVLSEIASGLLSLRYSRNDEEEADKFSVVYLCPTEYKADGAAGFFQKLIDEGAAGGTPEFLSTHPSPDNRVENITSESDSRGCEGDVTDGQYQAILDSLP